MITRRITTRNWRWPGVLGDVNFQAPDWANPDGITSIHALVEQVRAKPGAYATLIENPEASAISRCDEIACACREAGRILANCLVPERPEARTQLRVLQASAVITEQAATENAAILRARLAWEAVKNSVDPECSAQARDDAVTWYQAGMDALNRQIGPALDVARVYPDLANRIGESRETFFRHTFATHLRIRREECKRIKTVTGPDWEGKMTMSFREFLPATIGAGMT